MSWVWMQAWKQHFHMGRIKRSTVLQSQQLYLNMLGYTQPTLAGKRNPCPLLRQWRHWKTLCESAFYPCRPSWKSSLKLPLGSHVFRWEKSVFTIWHERCWTIAHFYEPGTPHTQVHKCRHNECKSHKFVLWRLNRRNAQSWDVVHPAVCSFSPGLCN